jgi:hypothetical protein
MTIALDHFIVPVHDREGSAERLAALLGVPWEPAGGGEFAPVYINEALTLDFLQVEEAIRPHHYCFRVDEEAFDAIFDRDPGGRPQIPQQPARRRRHDGKHALRWQEHLLE